MQLLKHGANPHRLYEQLKMSMPDTLFDFSENVNAFGLPKRVIEIWPTLLKEVPAYPDPLGEPFLSVAAKFHHLPTQYLFAGNGAAEILALLAERYRGKAALVLHPTFSEYEATLTAKKVHIQRVIASEETNFQLPIEAIKEAMHQVDVLYLCTPNNPTGLLPSRALLLSIIEHGKMVNCDVILDEAFIDFVDESLSFIPMVQSHEHLMIVRSMTKMYAIPGIRLGYVVAAPPIIEELQSFAPHWNVNGIAAEIGAICLKEEEFVEQTKRHQRIERQKLVELLTEYNCVTTQSVTNFIVFKLQDAMKTKQLYKDLLKKGIVLRHTENFHGMDGNWLRVGIKKEAQMSLLREELRRWFAEN